MKRDFDLIRSVLFQVEALPAGEAITQLTVDRPGISGPMLMEHLQIMIEEGLIEGEVLSVSQCAFGIYRLTWKGHDFLDTARSDTVWHQAKEKIVKAGGSASLEVFKAVLTQIAKAHLGIG
jgi:DNA-binding HxlR family transcriptional regulator